MSKHNEIQDLASVKFIFSKTVVDSDLFEHNSVKELFDYIDNKDVELNKVKFLIKKANMKLRIYDRQLFIRKSSNKEVENRICITKR